MRPVIRISTALILLIILAAGCSQPAQRPTLAIEQELPAETAAANLTRAAGENLPGTGTAETPALTPTPVFCAYVWEYRPLTELSSLAQAAVRQAGALEAQVTAEAYVESCLNVTNKTLSGSRLVQTDFWVELEIDNLDDREQTGKLAASLSSALIALPADQVPGIQPGLITVRFLAGEAEKKMSMRIVKVKEVLDQGFSGSAFLDALD